LTCCAPVSSEIARATERDGDRELLCVACRVPHADARRKRKHS
jgi:hypothetical protein